MSDYLFSEFEPVSSKQWKQKIQVDLKGADYNDTLVWESNVGIKVKPFYHQDDGDFLDIDTLKKQFSICQSIFVSEVKTANFLAKDALKKGANLIEFEANEAFHVKELLNNLNTPNDIGQTLSIYFKLNFLSEEFILELIENSSSFNVFLNIDIIGNLAKTGNWFRNNKEDHTVLEKILKKLLKILLYSLLILDCIKMRVQLLYSKWHMPWLTVMNT